MLLLPWKKVQTASIIFMDSMRMLDACSTLAGPKLGTTSSEKMARN